MDQQQILKVFSEAQDLIIPTTTRGKKNLSQENVERAVVLLKQLVEQIQSILNNIVQYVQANTSGTIQDYLKQQNTNDNFSYNLLDQIFDILNEAFEKYLKYQEPQKYTIIFTLQDYYNHLSETYEEINPRRRIISLKNMAILSDLQEEYLEGLDYISKAKFLSDFYQIKNELHEIYQTECVLFSALKEHENAINSQQQSLDYSKALLESLLQDPKKNDRELQKNSKYYIMGLYNLAEQYELIEDKISALDVYEQCFEAIENMVGTKYYLHEIVFKKIQSLRSDLFDLEYEKEDLLRFEEQLSILLQQLLLYVTETQQNYSDLGKIYEELLDFDKSQENYQNAYKLIADTLGEHHYMFEKLLKEYQYAKYHHQKLVEPFTLAMKEAENLCSQLDEYETKEIKQQRQQSYRYKLSKLAVQYDIVGDTELYRPEAIDWYQKCIDIIQNFKLEYTMRYGKKVYNNQMVDKKKFMEKKIKEQKDLVDVFEETRDGLENQRDKILVNLKSNSKNLSDFMMKNKLNYNQSVRKLASAYYDFGRKCEKRAVYDQALQFYEKAVMIIEQFMGKDMYLYESYLDNLRKFQYMLESSPEQQENLMDQRQQDLVDIDSEQDYVQALNLVNQVESVQHTPRSAQSQIEKIKQKRKHYKKNMDDLDDQFKKIAEQKQQNGVQNIYI